MFKIHIWWMLRLTWRNGRSGESGIEKRLDRFTIVESLLENFYRFRSWVDSSRISNHYPIICQFEYQGDRMKYPFKFSHKWLKEMGFRDLLK